LANSPPRGLKVPEGTTFEHWLALGKRLALADSALAWRIGDWWVHGEHRYGERISAVHASGWNGLSFGTCRNYATVARAFETSRRRDVLSFSHHKEVASLAREDADRLLDWAQEPLRNHDKPRSTRELCRQVEPPKWDTRAPSTGRGLDRLIRSGSGDQFRHCESLPG